MATPADFGLGQIGATVAPNQLAFPGLVQQIVESALPAQVHRQLYVQYPTGGFFAFTVPQEQGSSTAVAKRTGEGDEIKLDVAPISSTTVEVYKVARGHLVTREMILFQQVPIVQQLLKRLGLVMGNTIDTDSEATISAGRATANDVVATGKSLGVDMTEGTFAGTIGQQDIISGKTNVWNQNLFADSIALNPTGVGFLSRLPQFHAQYLYGVAGYRFGEIGEIEGLRVLMSTNTGASKPGANGAGSGDLTRVGYVVASGLRSSPLGQYVPMGYYGEALPLTSMLQDTPRRDGYEVYAVTLYAPVVTKGEAISMIDFS